jgi:putative lipoprotein
VRRGTSTVVIAALVGTMSLETHAWADSSDDPWFAEDKLVHYGVSAGIAGSGYVAGALIFDTRAHALAVGAGAAALAGVGKELVDLAGYGNASFKDLAWDGLGMVTGLAVAWGIDLLIRGVSASQPLFAGNRCGIAF